MHVYGDPPRRRSSTALYGNDGDGMVCLRGRGECSAFAVAQLLEWPVSECYGRNKKTQAECLRGLGAARQAHPKAWMVRVVVGCQPESSAIGRAQIGKTKARF
jgi:hypothetical protein